MPIYGYECRACDHTFDALQKISEDPLRDCPECGAPELKKQLSAPKFRLKGSGWYETDFKADNKRNLAGDADKSDGDSKAGDDKKTKADTTSSDKKPEPAKSTSKVEQA